MTHPDEEVPLLLNPVGSQFPYSATWYYRPEGSDADYKPLYKTGLEVWVNKLGEYKYVVSDKNGEEHEGMIRVAYEGEEPWIIGNPKSVTLKNREDRILFNMIICLPHQLSAELITREEAEQMLGK